jgi:ketosteroid isomerase-like protein
MSAENVERIRRLFELVGDGENPEALYELLDPAVEMTVAATDLDAGTYVGHAGVRRYFRRWAGTWEGWHFEPVQLVDDGDRVIVDLYQRGRGKGSGAEVENRPGQIWTFRDGLVVRWDNFTSFAEALDAARSLD